MNTKFKNIKIPSWKYKEYINDVAYPPKYSIFNDLNSNIYPI